MPVEGIDEVNAESKTFTCLFRIYFIEEDASWSLLRITGLL